MAAGGAPAGVVPALGAAQLGAVLLEEGLENLKAHPDREGEQALPGLAGQPGQLHAHPIRTLDPSLFGLSSNRNLLLLCHDGSSFLSAPSLPRAGRDGVEPPLQISTSRVTTSGGILTSFIPEPPRAALQLQEWGKQLSFTGTATSTRVRFSAAE